MSEIKLFRYVVSYFVKFDLFIDCQKRIYLFIYVCSLKRAGDLNDRSVKYYFMNDMCILIAETDAHLATLFNFQGRPFNYSNKPFLYCNHVKITIVSTSNNINRKRSFEKSKMSELNHNVITRLKLFSPLSMSLRHCPKVKCPQG